MARTVKTPGATTAPETNVDQADLLQGGETDQPTSGSVSEPINQSTGTETAPLEQSTSSVSEPINNEKLDQILKSNKRIEQKLDQLLKAGGIEAPKKMRWVQGKHGLEQKEI